MPMPIRDANDVNVLLRWIRGDNTYSTAESDRVAASQTLEAGRRLAAKAYKALGAGLTPGQVAVEIPASPVPPEFRCTECGHPHDPENICEMDCLTCALAAEAKEAARERRCPNCDQMAVPGEGTEGSLRRCPNCQAFVRFSDAAADTDQNMIPADWPLLDALAAEGAKETAAVPAAVGSLPADPALDKLEYQISIMNSALVSLLGRPGSTQEMLRMEYDRLAGMIQAHLIITRRTVSDSRAKVGDHARDKFGIDMSGLIVKIGLR